MDPQKIELENLSKIFEYEKISRELDSCDDLEQLRNISKCYAKLYFKQQETITLLDLESFKRK
jgi:hypothetical protein